VHWPHSTASITDFFQRGRRSFTLERFDAFADAIDLPCVRDSRRYCRFPAGASPTASTCLMRSRSCPTVRSEPASRSYSPSTLARHHIRHRTLAFFSIIGILLFLALEDMSAEDCLTHIKNGPVPKGEEGKEVCYSERESAVPTTAASSRQLFSPKMLLSKSARYEPQREQSIRRPEVFELSRTSLRSKSARVNSS
jgi:hypothetical protein